MLRWIRRLVFATFFGTLVAAGAYFRSEGFSQKWRSFVMDQFADHGVFLTLEKLTLDPLEGVVAQKIKVFQDREHQTQIASMDHLDLDLDYTKLLQHQDFIEGVDLRNASVSLPLDPRDPTSPKLELTELNARLFMQGDHLDIRKAEGRLFGLQVSISGLLLRPPQVATEEDDQKDRELTERRLAAIRARRGSIEQAARLLRHFESASGPTLTIQVNGDLSHPEQIKASLKLSAKGLQHGGYVCEELLAEATYADESIELSRLHLKDHLGEFDASANYRIGAPAVDFHVRSTADIPALASAIFEEDLKDDALRDFVFYKSDPLEFNVDGQALVESVAPDAFVPFRCTGMLHTGRFTSRGEIIDSVAVNFGLSPEGVYLRDVMIRHKSGTLGLQAMWRPKEGFRYRALLRMDPHVFLPFIPDTQIREIVNRFSFRDESNIYGEVEGAGPRPNIGKCQNHGHAELRNFKYNGVEFGSAEADVKFHGPQHAYSQIRIQRAEGKATADEVACDDDAHTVRLTKVVSDCDPITVTGCFAKETAAVIAKYRFDKIPHAEVDGLIQLEKSGSQIRVKFKSEGTAHYILWDDDYTIRRPAGDLFFKGPTLIYDVNGVLFGKDMACKGTASLEADNDDYTVNFRGGLFPYSVFGKPMPFENVRTLVNCRKGIVEFDLKSGLLDGTMSLKGVMDDRKGSSKSYQGELRYDALSFKKFARVYTPDFDTEGDLTGHFEFTGRLNDWKALHGTGAIVILNTNLYAVPILGPLTPLLGAFLPKPIKDFNIAKEADATFTVADGFAETKDLVALTGVFRLVANGKIDFLEDRVKFYAKAKFRGLPGIVLLPVSQILEYVSEGTVENPVWRPRYFSGSNERTQFRKLGEEPRPESAEPEKTSRPAVAMPPKFPR